MSNFAQDQVLWTHIPFFLALSRGGSLQAAAKLAGINRTTIKRRIDAIEILMQGRVFDSNDGNYTLTPLGRELLAVAESAEVEFQRVHEILDNHSDAARLFAGSIRIAISSHLLDAAKSLICAFSQTYPEIKLELLTSNSYADIERREVDVAFRIDKNEPQFPLVGENLQPLFIALYCKKDQFQPDINYVAKVGETSVPVQARTYMPHSKFILSVDGVLSHRELIAEGLGAGILPCFLCEQDQRLERISPILPGNGRHIWLVTHATLRNSPRIDLLFNFFRESWPQIA